jgi:hypothetical protein
MPLKYSSLSSTSSVTQYFVATTAGVTYKASVPFAPNVYTITCASSTTAYVEFFSGSTFIGKATTVSGTVAYNLATAADRIYYYTNTGSSISIGIELTGTNVSSTTNGTLDTITSTNLSYSQTGAAYVILVGGGAGGRGGTSGSTYSSFGNGGGSGSLNNVGWLNLVGTSQITIGAAGSAGATGGNAGGSGGTTTFINNGVTYTAGGGSGAGSGGSASGGSGTISGGSGGSGGSFGCCFNQVFGSSSSGTATTGIPGHPQMYSDPGTTGGGGGAGNGNSGPTSGAGSGIGAGGNGGGYSGEYATSGTGYGSGGGGGGGANSAAGNGAQGVVWILRVT